MAEAGVMQKIRTLAFGALLFAGLASLFSVQGATSAMAQQPQCWNTATNRLSDIIPGSITGGSWYSNQHSNGWQSHSRTVHRDGWSGARVNGFPVC